MMLLGKEVTLNKISPKSILKTKKQESIQKGNLYIGIGDRIHYPYPNIKGHFKSYNNQNKKDILKEHKQIFQK